MSVAVRSEIYIDVRGWISDEATSKRWIDADLDKYSTSGQREIVNRHPEAICNDDDISTVEVTTAAGTTTPVIDTAWQLALVHWISSSIFQEDHEDSGNARLAEWHMKQFEKLT